MSNLKDKRTELKLMMWHVDLVLFGREWEHPSILHSSVIFIPSEKYLNVQSLSLKRSSSIATRDMNDRASIYSAR